MMRVSKTPVNDFIYHWQLEFVGGLTVSQLVDMNRPPANRLDFDNLNSKVARISLVHTQTEEVKITRSIPLGATPVYFRRVGSPYVYLNSHRTVLKWFIGYKQNGQKFLTYLDLFTGKIEEVVE